MFVSAIAVYPKVPLLLFIFFKNIYNNQKKTFHNQQTNSIIYIFGILKIIKILNADTS